MVSTRRISIAELEGKTAFDAAGKPLSPREDICTITESGDTLIPPSVSVTPEAGVEPSVNPPPTDIAPPANIPVIVEAPIINVAPSDVIIRPEIIVQPQAVTVAAPDMQPIADALFEMREAITESAKQPVFIPPAQVSIEPQAPPDMTPIANAMIEIAKVEQSRPDHSGQILALLQQIAEKPTSAQWTFKVLRDTRGDIEEITAIKTVAG